MKDAFKLVVEAGDEGKRLDLFLARKVNVSRSRVQQLIAVGEIRVNGQTAKASYRLKPGDHIEGRVPEPEELAARPEDISLDILYEDGDIIVVNKPQGMVVHPSPGHERGTLVNALLFHCRDLSGINGVLRPGIVHRLDKDTSGVLVAAKNDLAHLGLAAQIKARSMKRLYLALVHGKVAPDEGRIEAPIGRHPVNRLRMAVVKTKQARPAVTHYRVLERLGNYTLLECRLETGRTHQIRVHMAYRGHPVVGDPVYGPRRRPFDVPGQLLHAYLLGFHHPRTGEYLEFRAPLPEIFTKILSLLRRQNG
ncbi:MAG: rRNA synthase [Clostridia bacterium]|nr:rRNA synthase [Clostridia bacterium]